MKVFVFGSNGMLGNYVSTYLKDYYEVIKVGRNLIDGSNTSENQIENVLLNLSIEKNDIIINCAGAIKPRVDELGDLNAIKINSVFPRMLANVCEKLEVKMIHPTTDCVYTGNKGSYNENDKYDVNDVYGMTKALGEPQNCTVIRTSIIGEEVGQTRSLIEWIKSVKGQTVFGFTNHYWNGVTCLQFAKICKEMIERNLFWSGTRHIHSNTVSKKELVELISEVYDLDVQVTPKETEISCDRSISSTYTHEIEIPTLKQQIEELKDFSKTLYN
jgi:dTDP-4-dehydrorhamnose reductase